MFALVSMFMCGCVVNVCVYLHTSSCGAAVVMQVCGWFTLCRRTNQTSDCKATMALTHSEDANKSLSSVRRRSLGVLQTSGWRSWSQSVILWTAALKVNKLERKLLGLFSSFSLIFHYGQTPQADKTNWNVKFSSDSCNLVPPQHRKLWKIL